MSVARTSSTSAGGLCHGRVSRTDWGALAGLSHCGDGSGTADGGTATTFQGGPATPRRRGLTLADLVITVMILSIVSAVADARDGMTSDRPYRQGESRQQASGIICEWSCRQLDVGVVQAFPEILVQRLRRLSPTVLSGDSNDA